MSEISIQKLTKKQKEQLRWYYLGEYEVTDIATKMNLEIDTVRFFIFGADGKGDSPSCLYQIKKGMSSTAISSFLMDKAAVLDKMAGTAANILSRSLSKLEGEVNSGETVLNMDDMKKLAGILMDLDKIVRLETGKATEHIEHLGLSMAEARQFMESDPFYTAIEAESKELSDTKLPWLDQSVGVESE